jgi:outer membrane protein
VKRKSLFLAAAMMVVGTVTCVYANQLTQIGVIDISKIISSYYQSSYALREINDMQQKFDSDKQDILNNIQSLEQQKLDAQNAGDSQKALDLDNEIFKQRNYLQDFIRIRTNQIKQKRDTLLQSPTFLSDLVKAIAYVAENEGYSIVLRSDDPSIMYWNKEVDITDKVIDRLKQTSSSASN